MTIKLITIELCICQCDRLDSRSLYTLRYGVGVSRNQTERIFRFYRSSEYFDLIVWIEMC